jgi:Uma2 family endonuclease
MVSNPITSTQPDVNETEEKDSYGTVIAENVSFEDYMLRYAENFCEWVDGTVIKMSPIHIVHDRLTDYLRTLLKAYFALRPIGTLGGAPFVMKLEAARSGREPDLQVILKASEDKLQDTMVRGPADICIEVVSPESSARDYGKKFEEYEKAGVPEYWIFDPLRESTTFYRLNDKKVYMPQPLDSDGNYTTPLLPGFKLKVALLWEDELPDFFEIGDMVKAMLAEK